jgi:hypothetical protein
MPALTRSSTRSVKDSVTGSAPVLASARYCLTSARRCRPETARHVPLDTRRVPAEQLGEFLGLMPGELDQLSVVEGGIAVRDLPGLGW